MKSILLSVRPEWVLKILNKEKTIEIRKKFPKDYVGWVYIYCTKVNLNKNKLLFLRDKKPSGNDPLNQFNVRLLNGKVVARFWCDFTFRSYVGLAKIVDEYKQLLKDSCLTSNQFENYVGDKIFYAIHISKLEVFDKPRELSEFRRNCCGCRYYKTFKLACNNCKKHRNIKAPQNLCYIEGEE